MAGEITGYEFMAIEGIFILPAILTGPENIVTLPVYPEISLGFQLSWHLVHELQNYAFRK